MGVADIQHACDLGVLPELFMCGAQGVRGAVSRRGIFIISGLDVELREREGEVQEGAVFGDGHSVEQPVTRDMILPAESVASRLQFRMEAEQQRRR